MIPRFDKIDWWADRRFMPHRRALQPAAPGSSRERLAALEQQLTERERQLTTRSIELQDLQTRYLDSVGGLYRQVIDLEAAIVDAEIRAGLRSPELLEPADASDAGDDEVATAAVDACASPSAPSSDLKRIFRNLAKTIHPDLALDDPARWRRHSLMAEANRAYAEQDEDRLRLILHAWERSPDAVWSDDPDSDDERLRRRIAQLEDRLLAIDRELAELERSAIAQLERKIGDAKRQGWDLVAEMVQEMKRDIRKATARLASLQFNAGR